MAERRSNQGGRYIGGGRGGDKYLRLVKVHRCL